jgi:hypothetical protein
MWTRKDLLLDPISVEFSAELRDLNKAALAQRSSRPFCAAFKPVVLLRAMLEAAEGDTVMWVDSSKRWRSGLSARHGIIDAVDALQATPPGQPVIREWQLSDWFRNNLGHHASHHPHSSTTTASTTPFEKKSMTNPPPSSIGSMYGIVARHVDWRDWNTPGLEATPDRSDRSQLECLARENWYGPLNSHCSGKSAKRLRCFLVSSTRLGYADLVGNLTDLLNKPHLLTTYMIFKNSPSNRLLVWDWLMMALKKPAAFCSSHTQDQGAWNVLAHNRSLPMTNLVLEERLQAFDLEELWFEKDAMVSADMVLDALTHHAFEHIRAQ